MLATEQSMIKEKNQKEIRKYLERNENGTKNFRMWQKIGGKKVKVESEEVGLKLNIQKTKIMASGPTT